VTLRVRVGAIFFYEITIRAAEETPVEITQVIALIVLPVFRELSRETRKRRTMQAGHKSFDHGAR
jgi:hypothetical protein